MNPEEVKKMKVPQLRELLKAQGKPISGTRDQLIARLETPLEELNEAREAARAQGAAKAKATRETISPHRKPFENKNVKELKEELKERDLKVSGNRAQLLRRLAYYEAGLPEPKTPKKSKKTPKQSKPIVMENLTLSPSSTKGKKSMSGNLPMIPISSSRRSTSPPSSRRSTSPPSRRASQSNSPLEDLDHLRTGLETDNISQLKNKLRKRGLSTAGEKPELINRLFNAVERRLISPQELEEYDHLRTKVEGLTVSELKKKLRKRGLSTGGEKPELINRLFKAKFTEST